ncbi:NTP transferase domain-containing protein [Halobaculum sp. WSA2]|uniref:NTP transferase domain-containing protein n=2 Tax=Halobaculum saliterrae TaxID=2073113 RepID=A0A6B0SZB9_9EURY|nr:NTP transferase domain-containing protein [Halobaculum saliterrae]
MCGGRGTRLGAVGDGSEKPLVEVGDIPMVDRVLDALAGSRVEGVHAVVSPHTPATARHLIGRDDLTVIEAPGNGYVSDLGYALERIDRPVLTVASDLPLLTAEVVDRALDAATGDTGDAVAADGAGVGTADGAAASLAVYVPVDRKREVGASVDERTTTVDGREVVPTGLNVVGDEDGEPVDESALVVAGEGLAVNANRPRDLRVAEALLHRQREGTEISPDHGDHP